MLERRTTPEPTANEHRKAIEEEAGKFYRAVRGIRRFDLEPPINPDVKGLPKELKKGMIHGHGTIKQGHRLQLPTPGYALTGNDETSVSWVTVKLINTRPGSFDALSIDVVRTYYGGEFDGKVRHVSGVAVVHPLVLISYGYDDGFRKIAGEWDHMSQISDVRALRLANWLLGYYKKETDQQSAGVPKTAKD